MRSVKQDQWWGGLVTRRHVGNGMHYISYDDGDVEVLPLGTTACELTSFGPEDVGRRVAIYWGYEARYATIYMTRASHSWSLHVRC